MKKCLLCIFALLCACLTVGAQTPIKVGVISFQNAIVSSKDGQKAAKDLDAKVAPKNKEFQNRQAEIAQMEEQLRKGGTVMAEEKRNQLVRDVDEKKKRLERDMQDAEEDIRGEQQRILTNLSQRMAAVIEKYAKDNGYSVIMDASNQAGQVLWSSPSVDITAEIVALYDKSAPAAGKL